MVPFLPDQTRIAQVRLRTANLERLLEFYRGVLGLKVLERAGPRASLSATGQTPALIVLNEEPDAAPRPLRATGLYHFALRYPSRSDLAQACARLVKAGYPIEGAADHGVSEAIYLSDPDNNGVELYTDRPRAQWPYRDGRLAMTAATLDLKGLLASVKDGPVPANPPARLDIGHIHLHVTDLGEAERFYRELIGLSVTQRSLPGALFLSAGDYHHHLGVNTWAGRAPAPPKSAGLISYRMMVPVPEVLYCLEHRAPLLGYEAHRESSPGVPDLLRIRDPNGNWLEIQSSEGSGLVSRCGFRRSSMTKESRSDKLIRSI
jgi:catechol 2,3-dioxygenase